MTARAPVPPEVKKTYVNGRRSMSLPAIWMPRCSPSFGHHAPGQRLLERARDRVRQEVADHVARGDGSGMPRVEDAAGGAEMRIGRKAPSLFGTSGLTMTLTP